MREQKLRMLIKLVEDSKIDELEISRWGKKIRICKNNINGSLPSAASSSPPVFEISPTSSEEVSPPPVQAPTPQSSPPIPESSESETTALEKDLVEIKSPMVGTFYRQPAPDEDPYVEEGDSISPGKVLCIIEAMKLMNEIESDISGTIVKIYIENAAPVEYNQPLFLVKTS